jgi:hypothetical protein
MQAIETTIAAIGTKIGHLVTTWPNILAYENRWSELSG